MIRAYQRYFCLARQFIFWDFSFTAEEKKWKSFYQVMNHPCAFTTCFCLTLYSSWYTCKPHRKISLHQNCPHFPYLYYNFVGISILYKCQLQHWLLNDLAKVIFLDDIHYSNRRTPQREDREDAGYLKPAKAPTLTRACICLLIIWEATLS